MNARLKSLLQTAWNEPRLFFFWTGLLGASGCLVSGALSERWGRIMPLRLVALCSILGFVLGFPAFILAWVPPIRRLLARLLRRRVVVLACLAMVVALFYGVEDWRGWRAWQQFQRAGEAKGERFDLASFIPPPVPKNQNFFETPLWQDLRWAETNRPPSQSDGEREGHAVFAIYSPDGGSAPSSGNWARVQPVDLVAWQGFYRGNSNLVSASKTSAPQSAAEQAFRRRYGLVQPAGSLPTNYFPTAKEPQTPAADVLLALSKFQHNRDLLIVAAARPQSRFWLNYEAGTAMTLPHLERLKTTAQYLNLHASAALAAGQKDTAYQDIALIFRLLDSIRREPLLLCHSVRMSALQLALQPVWEGLAARQWTAADLVAIEAELGKLDFPADYRLAVRGELVCYWLWIVDYVQQRGMGDSDSPYGSGDISASEEVRQVVESAIFLLIPSGWFDQNRLALARVAEDYFLPVADLQRRVLSPAVAAQSEAALAPLGRGIYDALLKLLISDVARTGEKFAYAQTSADLARIACALERYRLAHGDFPETTGRTGSGVH